MNTRKTEITETQTGPLSKGSFTDWCNYHKQDPIGGVVMQIFTGSTQDKIPTGCLFLCRWFFRRSIEMVLW